MKKLNEKCPNPLVEFVSSLRKRAIGKKKEYSKEQLEKPVSFWTKDERLLNGIGKEITVILKTKGCSWALSDSGGCSMCGYIQDANIKPVPSQFIIKQFDYALEHKLNEIQNQNFKYIIKIFNSGSFFDDSELNKEVRIHIYNKISEIKAIKEVVIESRVEYLTPDLLLELKEHLKNKYIEIGIGLETVNDYIRNSYINKGLSYDSFLEAFDMCKQNKIGVKAYLLFKPPFLNEQAAIDDCTESIKSLINLEVNTISINPLNIQRGSLAEYLWYQNRYRPPWFYSLFECIKNAVNQNDLKSTRVLSDPSGAGTKRGIHNCLKRECNEAMIEMLRKFVLNQDLSVLNQKQTGLDCDCKKTYLLQRDYH
ncbi:MAG: TIGR01210 family radical SAM protein [Promethearchaeota archaeon]|nr:MAG: TIGR01210 family radical SAM protein [Candidatus Lokiarchaeota archaeon]